MLLEDLERDLLLGAPEVLLYRHRVGRGRATLTLGRLGAAPPRQAHVLVVVLVDEGLAVVDGAVLRDRGTVLLEVQG